MAKEATLQVRMDADLKEQVEELYKKLGTFFAEAVKIFARQSVQENAMPFTIHIPQQKTEQRIAQAKEENMSFITHDSLIPYYMEPCIVSV